MSDTRVISQTALQAVYSALLLQLRSAAAGRLDPRDPVLLHQQFFAVLDEMVRSPRSPLSDDEREQVEWMSAVLWNLLDGFEEAGL